MSRPKPKQTVKDDKAPVPPSATHQFWSKQPVVASAYSPAPPPSSSTTADGDSHSDLPTPSAPGSEVEGVIDPNYLTSHKQPFPLPSGFEWYDVDVHNADDLSTLHVLLRDHYVEDSAHASRVDYSPDFLRWALTSPNHSSRFHVAVRLTSSKKLVAFICGTLQLIRIRQHEAVSLEISFLCVHAKLRRQRLAPVLIKEIARRRDSATVKHAVYTAGTLIHQPLTHCTYYHRPLNVASLVTAGFIPHPALLSTPPPRTEVARTAAFNRFVKRNALPAVGQGGLPELRAMTEDDVAAVHSLLTEYLSAFSLVPLYDQDEVRHWFLPRPAVLYSYVLYEQSTLVAFVSFHCVPRLHNYTTPTPTAIRTANASYHINRSTTTTRAAILKEVLSRAKAEGFDVYSVLDMMGFDEWMESDGGRFLKSNGGVYYYLFNYQCKEMTPQQIGLVVL